MYLLTPWCRVLLEKLIGLQLVKKFPAFHGALKFITSLVHKTKTIRTFQIIPVNAHFKVPIHQRWRQKAVDREEWASVIKEAEALSRSKYYSPPAQPITLYGIILHKYTPT